MPFLTVEAPASATASRGLRRAIAAAFVLVSIAYVAQCATPLRLINDGVDYLLQTSSALDGHGFLLHGVRSMRPPGYPALIVLLAKLGLGTSWAIVALNCVLLGLGAWTAYFVLRISFGFSRETAQLISLLTLLSYLMVRNTTYPLSDISYFGLSVPCLVLLAKIGAEERPVRWLWLVAIVPLIFVCIEVRTIGIVLIPAFVWAAMGGMRGARAIAPVLCRHWLILLVLLLVITVVAGNAFFHSRYMQFNLPIFLHRGIVRSITANIGYHTAEWGEMVVNAPLSKLPAALEIPARILGGFAIVTFLIGLWTRRREIDSLLVYVVGGAGIVGGYPWFDTRLWLPFLPFLMGYMILGLRRVFSPRMVRPALIAYCAYYVLLGILALGYSSRITFSGAHFPEVYGDGNFRATYRLMLLGEQPKNGEAIDPDAVYLLQRFEPRAAR